MLKTHRRKRFFAVAAAAVTALTAALTAAPALPASAADPQYSSIVVLGDSISAGYGLKQDEYNYGMYLGEMYGGTVQNYAASGTTTDGLLTKLDSEPVQNAVKGADLICLSIGGNDMLQPMRDYFSTLRHEGESMMETLSRLAQSSSITFYIGQLTSTLREPIAHAKENFPIIEQKLRELNPDAQIVVQTIYNPFERSKAELARKTEAGVENYNDYIAYINGQESKLNESIKKMSTCKIADTYAAFKGSGWIYVRSQANDVHPNALGHALIAELIAEKVGGSTKTFERIGKLLADMPAEDYSSLPANNSKRLVTHAVIPEAPFGDVDANGYISLEDALSVLLAYTNMLYDQPLGLSYQSYLSADVSGDGAVGLGDALSILQYYSAETLMRTPKTWYELTNNPNAPDAPPAPRTNSPKTAA